MVTTVVVSGGFGFQDEAGMDGFVTANLGGAAGDVVSMASDDGKKVLIVVAKG